MGIFDVFRRQPEAASVPSVNAMGSETGYFPSLNDPRLLEFIRDGGGAMTQAGVSISPKLAMKNTTVMRCVSLISFSIGMLPLHLHEKDTKAKASGHPLYQVLHRKPNAWQTSFEFRSLMQQRALSDGNAYARIVWSGSRVLSLVPLPGESQVKPKQRSDWTLEYEVRRPNGDVFTLPQREVFHLRYGLSEDGITGLSLVKQAAEAIALAIQTEKAAARLFKNGMIVGGYLKHPGKLSQEAFERLKESMAENEGASNAHKWKVLEEGMDIGVPGQSGKDSQAIEQRKHQIEEIARPFGVPRPLLGVDDTSWGSGIDVLGQFFVRYGLNPWFEAWQQAIERSLLSDAEADRYEAKFNPAGLLRGSMKDQAEFFAKGLGSGGHQPFLEVDEVRGWLDLGHSDNLPERPGPIQGGRDELARTA